MYTTGIISLLSLPVLILVSYYTALYLIKKYETKTENDVDND